MARVEVVTHLIVTERERDTILAALRYWQRIGIYGGSGAPERELAENDRTGDDAALLDAEIDTLCERINK